MCLTSNDTVPDIMDTLLDDRVLAQVRHAQAEGVPTLPLQPDNDTVPDIMGALFDDVVLALGARAQAKGVPALPLQPDPALPSYYVARAQPAMTREDFLAPSCLDADDLAERLGAYWQAHARHDLLPAVPRIVAAARAAQADFALSKPSETEVSPFIYVMF